MYVEGYPRALENSVTSPKSANYQSNISGSIQNVDDLIDNKFTLPNEDSLHPPPGFLGTAESKRHNAIPPV